MCRTPCGTQLAGSSCPDTCPPLPPVQPHATPTSAADAIRRDAAGPRTWTKLPDLDRAYPTRIAATAPGRTRGLTSAAYPSVPGEDILSGLRASEDPHALPAQTAGNRDSLRSGPCWERIRGDQPLGASLRDACGPSLSIRRRVRRAVPPSRAPKLRSPALITLPELHWAPDYPGYPLMVGHDHAVTVPNFPRRVPVRVTAPDLRSNHLHGVPVPHQDPIWPNPVRWRRAWIVRCPVGRASCRIYHRPLLQWLPANGRSSSKLA